MKIPLSILKHTGGSAIIEMALVLPLFFLALFGFFECAHVLWIRSTMESALVSASRFAIINAASDARIRSQFQSGVYGMDPRGLTFTSASTQDQGIYYETFTTTKKFIPLLNITPALNNVVLQAQITLPAPAGIFDCGQQAALMNTVRGSILRAENDTQSAIQLLKLDEDGTKTLYASLGAGESQIFAIPLQNGQPIIVADDSGTCKEIVVPWRPTSNLIISDVAD